LSDTVECSRQWSLSSQPLTRLKSGYIALAGKIRSDATWAGAFNLTFLRNIQRYQIAQSLPLFLQFDDDVDPPSEDEDGEETPVLQSGLFAKQDFKRLKTRCIDARMRFVDPQFPPSPSSLYVNASGLTCQAYIK
jgi:hypothetical protein